MLTVFATPGKTRFLARRAPDQKTNWKKNTLRVLDVLLCRSPLPTALGQGVLPLEDRASRVGTALALDAKRDGEKEGAALPIRRWRWASRCAGDAVYNDC